MAAPLEVSGGYNGLYYPQCRLCVTPDDPEGEEWYDKDPKSGLFGRPWRTAVDLAVNHLREEHPGWPETSQ